MFDNLLDLDFPQSAGPMAGAPRARALTSCSQEQTRAPPLARSKREPPPSPMQLPTRLP
ncbi:hypothetical protein T484DRAFT_1985537 [Baffinella frigidus]|nr:hypothetical protein T484DRAFT_1985537 [Cryptophyta sp. CCMP2293]